MSTTTIAELANTGELLLCRFPESSDFYVIFKYGHNKFITQKMATRGNEPLPQTLEKFKQYNEKQRLSYFTNDMIRLTFKELQDKFSNAEIVSKRISQRWMSAFLPLCLEKSLNSVGSTIMMPPKTDYEGFTVFIPSKLFDKERYVLAEKDKDGNPVNLQCYNTYVPPEFKFTLTKIIAIKNKKIEKEERQLSSQQFIELMYNAAKTVAKNLDDLPQVFINERLYEKNAPKALIQENKWVGEKLTWNENKGKFEKMIINPHTGYYGMSNDCRTWGTFKQACESIKKFHLDGVGYVISEEQNIFCLDLDLDKKTKKLSENSRQIYLQLKDKTYMEYSASGALHIFGIANIQGNAVLAQGDATVELFKRGHAIMITGKKINDHDVNDVQSEMDSIYEKFFTPKEDASVPKKSTLYNEMSFSELDEKEVCDKLLSGKQSSKFNALMKGDVSDYGGDQGYNAADLALCSLIAYYTDNPNIIDSIYRKSGLYSAQKYYGSVGRLMTRSEKWDKNRSGGSYGEQTIMKALQTRMNRYTGIELISIKDPLRIFAESKSSYLIRPKDKLEDGNYTEKIWLPKDRCKVETISDRERFVVATTSYYIDKYDLMNIKIGKEMK